MCHRGQIAADKEGFLLSGALEPAHFPNSSKKILDRGGNSYPECGTVGRNDGALRPSRDQLLEENHEATDSSELIVRILPGGAVARHRDSPPENALDDINAERVERVSFRRSEILRKSGDSRETDICPCDPDPAHSVRLRVNSGEMPAGPKSRPRPVVATKPVMLVGTASSKWEAKGKLFDVHAGSKRVRHQPGG